jgi:hypothetical protein
MKRFVMFCLVVCVLAAPAHAQTPARDTIVNRADTIPKGITPGKAFMRSLLIPGWGQFSVGARTRGFVFIGLQSASWFMLVKTLNKLSDAHDVADERVAFASDSLHRQMSTDTALARKLASADSFNARVEAFDTVKAIRSLINSREEQRQDWITYVLFTTLASGVDAFVAAHLADFPTTITTTAKPNGAVQVKFTVPVQRRR